MKYPRLGKSGLRVSEFCLGTMTFGKSTTQEEADEMVAMALEAGVTFFDTANGYSAGESERMLGKALGARRTEVVVATKVTNPMGSGPNDSGWSRAHILRAVDDSLTRLGTDYIDVYYLHHTENQTPLEETLRTLDNLVRSGKVRYIACSNFEAWRLCDALWTSKVEHLEPFVCYQANYSLAIRDIEHEIVPLAQQKGLGIVAYAALGGGFFTGKYEPGQRVLEGTRSEEGWVYPGPHFSPEADKTLREVFDIAARLDCEPGHVAIAWVLSRPAVSAALVGARSPEQLRKNLSAVDVSIPEEDLARLNEVSQPALPYPQWMEAGQHDRREQAIEKT